MKAFFFFENHTKNIFSSSLWEKICGQKAHKNFSGKFGRAGNSAKNPSHPPYICLLPYLSRDNRARRNSRFLGNGSRWTWQVTYSGRSRSAEASRGFEGRWRRREGPVSRTSICVEDGSLSRSRKCALMSDGVEYQPWCRAKFCRMPRLHQLHRGHARRKDFFQGAGGKQW